MNDLLAVTLLALGALVAAYIPSLPPITLALVVTACGILLTARSASAQKQLAARKLFLDLMPRRAEWYDRVKLALEGRQQERVQHTEIILSGSVPPTGEHLAKLWQLETEAGWLFGKEMVALMALMIEAEKQVHQRQLEARQGSREAALDVGNKMKALYDAQGKLQDYLVNYLYVGDIGKPKQSPVQFAKEPSSIGQRLLGKLNSDRRG